MQVCFKGIDFLKLSSGEIKRILLIMLLANSLLNSTSLVWASSDKLVEDNFESGLSRWKIEQSDYVEILVEPGTTNHVLQLTPKPKGFVDALLANESKWENVRFEGRFLFPKNGNGYLGFIYNHEVKASRTDFGCIYVKSNGSYVRVSPHYDGNPSWRLYEDMRVELIDERRMEVGRWYNFRLDVQSANASLYIVNMDVPVVNFALAPNKHGALGLEARPGGGESVWVDDIAVLRLPPKTQPHEKPTPSKDKLSWEIYGPVESTKGAKEVLPEFDEEGWLPFEADSRGALITGLATQYRSGDEDVVYLRAYIDVAENKDAPTWLAISTANPVDVWYRGYYRGTAGNERFIWSDFTESAQHPGARFSLLSKVGRNEVVLRVNGRRFAGGGLFVEAVSQNYPE